MVCPACNLERKITRAEIVEQRREMVKQRWNPMGIISPGSPGLYEEQFTKALGKYAEYAICNTVWFNPKSEMTRNVGAAFAKLFEEVAEMGK